MKLILRDIVGLFYDMVAAITDSNELEAMKEHCRKKEGGRINMCQAIREMKEEARMDGIMEGKIEGKRTIARNMHRQGMPAEMIASICEAELEQVNEWISER